MRRLVVGGAGLAVAAALPRRAGASNALAPPIAFRGAVRQGPSAGLELAGELWLEVTASGEVVHGDLALPDGGYAATAVGQVDGHALTLLLRLADGRRVAAVGAVEFDIYAGKGMLSGVLSGPLPGDRGDWQGGYERDAAEQT